MIKLDSVSESKPKTDKCCANCKFCSELKTPRVRSDGAAIFGYCFKDGDTNHSLNMGKGFPIWIDTARCGAICEEFKKREISITSERESATFHCHNCGLYLDGVVAYKSPCVPIKFKMCPMCGEKENFDG